MRLFDRLAALRIWQKLLLIAVSLGVPAAAFATFYVFSLGQDRAFVRAELDGLDQVEPLNRLTDAVSAHRTLADAYLKAADADKAYYRTRMADARTRADDAARAVDAADARTGSPFGTAEKWKQAKAAWAAAAEVGAQAAPAEVADRHARALAGLLGVQTDISEKSNLILDPILVTYYLQDNLTLRTTTLIETTGDVRAAAMDAAAKKELAPADRTKLADLLGRYYAARAGSDGNVTVLRERDAATYGKLAPDHAQATAAGDAFATLVREKLVDAAAPTTTPTEVWERGTAVLTAYARVNDDGAAELRSQLGVRQSGFAWKQYGVAALIVAVLAVGGLVYVMARGVTRQLAAMTDTLGKIGMGEFDARADVTSGDELGELAGTFNAMLENTTSLMQSQDEKDRIQASIEKLLADVAGAADGDLTADAAVAEDLTGPIAGAFNHMLAQLRGIIGNVQRATVEVTGSAGEITSSTRDLAGGAEQQADKIADTSRAVQSMAASIRDVSANAATSADVARQALQNARDGNASVKTTIAGMDRIRDQVQETAKRIKRLGESSQEIGQITQLIDDIADRTSILALNASIQAAMAGEAGRGFAVVAEEVERLADRSTEATKKIASLVKTIQSETTEAVGAMEKGIAEVVEGSRLAATAGQALDQIETVSDRLAGLIGQISTAAQGQAKESEGVTRVMSEISGITQTAAGGSKQTAAAAEGLAALADELRESVAAFRLPAPVAAPKARNGRANGHAPRNRLAAAHA